MLIEFTVGNYKSFKDPVTLSMVAAKLSAKDSNVDQENTFKVKDDLTLLVSAAVYGANASGKSNLVSALGFMCWLVLNSSKESQAKDPIGAVPFRLDTNTEKQPSFFEIVFRQDDIPYRYGFEITTEKVISEWLFYSPRGREAKLFVRDESGISISRNFKGGKSSKSLTRANALFISVAAQFNSETANNVLNWFRSVNFISGLDDTSYGGFTAHKFSKEENYRTGILQIIRDFDIGIDDVRVEKGNINEPGIFPSDMPQEIRDIIIKQMGDESEVFSFKTIHVKRDSEKVSKQYAIFDMEDESEGTQKLFLLSGPILDTLQKGKVLVIDEIEARLHTLLTRKLIGLFNSPNTNPKNAQLIFATHDTNLLSNKIFRRDQIWFVEKDNLGASHLYSLAELKVRNDASFENDYLQGKYGAIPMFGELRHIVLDDNDKVVS